MAKIFDGFNGSTSWLEDFITSQAAEEVQKEALAGWEDDVIRAVKTRRYSNVEEAITDMQVRAGLSETAACEIKAGVLKKVATDKEWHSIHGTTTPQLKTLANTKINLLQLANDFDGYGELAIANAIDEALSNLPDA